MAAKFQALGADVHRDHSRPTGLRERNDRQPDRPRWLLPATLLLGFFALDPLNFAFPVLGVVDDFVLLPLLLRALVSAAVPALRASRDHRVVSEQ